MIYNKNKRNKGKIILEINFNELPRFAVLLKWKPQDKFLLTIEDLNR